MKRRIIILLALVLQVAWGQSLAEGANQVNDIQLTEAQVQLLVAMGSSEQRIRSGTLTSVEMRVLDEAHRGEAYMAERYGVMFQAVDCVVDWNGAGIDQFDLRLVNGLGNYRLFVNRSGEGEAYQDDYVSSLLESSYTQMLQKLLPEVSNGCVYVRAGLPYAYGSEYDPKLSVEEILARGLSLYALTDIAVWGIDEAEFNVFADQTEEVIRARGLIGSHIIHLLAKEPGDGESPSSVDDLIRQQVVIPS